LEGRGSTLPETGRKKELPAHQKTSKISYQVSIVQNRLRGKTKQEKAKENHGLRNSEFQQRGQQVEGF